MSAKGITLAQVATDAKSNEITAIPPVLELIDVRGAVIGNSTFKTRSSSGLPARMGGL
jgi:hypothetical protein